MGLRALPAGQRCAAEPLRLTPWPQPLEPRQAASDTAAATFTRRVPRHPSALAPPTASASGPWGLGGCLSEEEACRGRPHTPSYAHQPPRSPRPAGANLPLLSAPALARSAPGRAGRRGGLLCAAGAGRCSCGAGQGQVGPGAGAPGAGGVKRPPGRTKPHRHWRWWGRPPRAGWVECRSWATRGPAHTRAPPSQALHLAWEGRTATGPGPRPRWDRQGAPLPHRELLDLDDEDTSGPGWVTRGMPCPSLDLRSPLL